MKGLLALFGRNSKEIDTVDNRGILSEPGDRLEARVTKTNRKVLKIEKEQGASKYSATEYPNGTLVETKVTKRK